MQNNYFISIYLDSRRAKQNGKYPVRLRLFTKHPRKQKLYPTVFEFTKAEFKSIYETTKPRKEYKAIRLQLQNLENLANDVASKIKPFDFKKFENIFFGYSGDNDNVFFQYDLIISNFKRNNKISTADTYKLSMKSIKNFLTYTRGKEPKKLSFTEVSPELLKLYESYMIENKKSTTTISIYLRALRAVFNFAIDEKITDKANYPFGKRKYQIPNPKGVKKALSKEQLAILFNTEPQTPEQQKAKDFWFFSYACNGMNFKDIANLKYKNFDNETIYFYRAKTGSTNSEQAPVTVYVNEFIKSVIDKYGNTDDNVNNYIFKIINPESSPEEQHRQLKNFVRFVNQNFLKLAKNAGFNEKISTYWARHSFATNAIRNGASMEFISEALNHTDLKTTKKYFAGFTNDLKKDFANKLMDF
jgi:integrase/recombinase XerD